MSQSGKRWIVEVSVGPRTGHANPLLRLLGGKASWQRLPGDYATFAEAQAAAIANGERPYRIEPIENPSKEDGPADAMLKEARDKGLVPPAAAAGDAETGGSAGPVAGDR